MALPARWDADSVARAMVAVGIPARPSFHAGTYACNAALFLALHGLPIEVPVGFVHVPRRGGPEGTRLADLQKAVEIALGALRA